MVHLEILKANAPLVHRSLSLDYKQTKVKTDKFSLNEIEANLLTGFSMIRTLAFSEFKAQKKICLLFQSQVYLLRTTSTEFSQRVCVKCI